MPVTKFDVPEKYTYLDGFGNYQQSEALENTLPIGQNTPQIPAHGLYAERISGTTFTAPRAQNQQVWLYRILPTATHAPFPIHPSTSNSTTTIASQTEMLSSLIYTPTQLRWSPLDVSSTSGAWPTSMHLIAGAGNIADKSGLSVSVYTVGESMSPTTSYSSSDGDLLIIPQQGTLDIRTEFGNLLVRPCEICLIPRGVRYRVSLLLGEGEQAARGYAIELFEGHFTLPERGPIGSHGLANERDFQVPVADFEHDDDSSSSSSSSSSSTTYQILTKFAGQLFETTQEHSPFNVVAWHGTYYPWKYDLGRFATIGSISFDHPDPSIFSLLTAPGHGGHGSPPIAEIAIFPPRWLVMEGTFRPPWFHRNTMGELMGLIKGEYDAKVDGGFRPGGVSLHNTMVGHGPDAGSVGKGSEEELVPVKVGEGSLAFVVESSRMWGVSPWALGEGCGKVQGDYNERTWGGIRSRFRMPSSSSSSS